MRWWAMDEMMVVAGRIMEVESVLVWSSISAFVETSSYFKVSHLSSLPNRMILPRIKACITKLSLA
jgi:hypothetical protein